MPESLKYALVTGASSGIGWHISRELAARAYGIVAVSNQRERLADLKSELERHFKVTVKTLELDLSRQNAASQIHAFCQAHMLLVEVLVNNAGMMHYGEVLDTREETVRSMMNLHMHTPVMLCRFFGSHMQEQGKGYILNVSSISAVMPYPKISLYGPTKGFLRKFTRALRHEMKAMGVHVTCLIPGATKTSLYDTSKINVSLAIRLHIMKQADDVARAGLKALFRNRPVRIPGTLNKLVVYLFPLFPAFFIAWVYKLVKKKGW